MTLGERQEEYTLAIAKLIIWAYEQGYKIRMGEGFNAAGIGHKKDSNHYIKLANDLLVFKSGAVEQDLEAHKRMHDAWDALGGAPRIEHDLNHYSFEWKGRW